MSDDEDNMISNTLQLREKKFSNTRVSDPVLKREILQFSLINELVIKDDPEQELIPEAKQQQSIDELMKSKPDGDLWIFGYGSLVWNPAIQYAERKFARINGWHRKFCLSITALRATAQQPGLMLALDKGGFCDGTAYRISEGNIYQELLLLWRREMICSGYIPRWVQITDHNDIPFGWALTFTIDSEHPRYVGDLVENAIAQHLSVASGGLGSAADYLFRTHEGLQANGIRDSHLERLTRLVRNLIN
jgi:cation transport protein ChaC